MPAHDDDLDEWSPQGPVTELSDEHAWELLALSTFGHLGVSVDGRPDIFPVDYIVDDRSILFRTATGTKLRDLTLNHAVVFEVDRRDQDGAWSVTVKGSAHVVDDESTVPLAVQSALPSWVPTSEYVFVLVVPHEVRGRRFEKRLPLGRIGSEAH